MINIKNLSVFYDNNEVLSNINLSLEKLDYLSIIGENGSGKTTLIKTILGLIKYKKGSITFNSINKNEIGYLPQQKIIQISFPCSVFEVVISGRLNKKRFIPFYNSEDKKIALENIKKLNIENLTKKSYRNLSGGQQQRVQIARALCSTKELLILDEPTSSLDPIATIDLYKLIKKLNNDISIIMVSHDINNAIKY